MADLEGGRLPLYWVKKKLSPLLSSKSGFATDYQPPWRTLFTIYSAVDLVFNSGADLGGGCRGCAPPWDKAFFFVYTYSLLIFFTSPSVMSFLRVAPPPKKNPESAPVKCGKTLSLEFDTSHQKASNNFWFSTIREITCEKERPLLRRDPVL